MMGWIKDAPDDRDRSYAAPRVGALPERFSLRRNVQQILDQGNTSSCVAHAYAQAIAVCEDLAGLPYDPISRLYLYSCARAVTGDERADGGTYLRSGAKALQLMGAPPEDSWPFRESQVNSIPGLGAHMLAHPRRNGRYARIAGSGEQRLHACRAAIASGQPFVFGTTVAESIFDYEGGVIDRPADSDPIAGGHALCCVGYSPEGFLIANSWGPSWGVQGFCWLSNDYMAWSETSDLWIVEGWKRITDARTQQEVVS